MPQSYLLLFWIQLLLLQMSYFPQKFKPPESLSIFLDHASFRIGTVLRTYYHPDQHWCPVHATNLLATRRYTCPCQWSPYRGHFWLRRTIRHHRCTFFVRCPARSKGCPIHVFYRLGTIHCRSFRPIGPSRILCHGAYLTSSSLCRGRLFRNRLRLLLILHMDTVGRGLLVIKCRALSPIV